MALVRVSDPQGSIDDCSNIEMSPAVGDNGPEDVEISEKKRLAADRRKKIMEQMKSAQRNFMKENAQLFNVILSYLLNFINIFNKTDGFCCRTLNRV